MALCCQGETGEEWVIIFKYGRRLERSWECSFYLECDLKFLGKKLSLIFRRPFGFSSCTDRDSRNSRNISSNIQTQIIWMQIETMRHAHRVEVHGPVIRMSIGFVGHIALIVVLSTRITNPVSMLFVQTERVHGVECLQILYSCDTYYDF
jgi:hypothetical protein